MTNRWLVSMGLSLCVAGCSSDSTSTVFGATSSGSGGTVITGAGGAAGSGGGETSGGMGGAATGGTGGQDPTGGNGGTGAAGGAAGSGGAGGGAAGSAGAGGVAGSGGAGGGAGSGSGGGGTGGAGGGPVSADNDLDGLDDALEDKLARDYLPFLSLDPGDGCSRGGIAYRLRPHPNNAALINIVYDHLYEHDCGLTSHVGDNEVFGVTIDPNIPPPAGILTIVAIGHQATLCEKKTSCGSCGGLAACSTGVKNGAAYPVVFSSKDKHASYVQKDKCNPILSCFDTCTLAPTSTDVALVNVGEPNAHLVSDLTDQGFITTVNGWTEQELFHRDPWDTTKDFGGAGNVAADFVDPAFVSPVCP